MILPILIYPDSRLQESAAPTLADDSARALAADMLETMRAAKGVGLAAPQVGESKRIVVIDISPDRDSPMILINPEIIQAESEATAEEGCLSIPGVVAEVRRPAIIRFRAQNAGGDFFEQPAEGLLAVCVQHEIDHLNGILFIDRLSRLKRSRVLKRYFKLQRGESE